jgi:hypothetical protein
VGVKYINPKIKYGTLDILSGQLGEGLLRFGITAALAVLLGVGVTKYRA